MKSVVVYLKNRKRDIEWAIKAVCLLHDFELIVVSSLSQLRSVARSLPRLHAIVVDDRKRTHKKVLEVAKSKNVCRCVLIENAKIFLDSQVRGAIREIQFKFGASKRSCNDLIDVLAKHLRPSA